MVIVSHDGINDHAPVVIAVPLTSRTEKRALPTHVFIPRTESGLRKDSLALAEQVRVVSKQRMARRVGGLSPTAMREIGLALKRAQGLD